MSVILMTTLFYKELILQGEIWCWSLLGLKGLISILNITLGTYNVRRLKNSNEFTGLFKISVSWEWNVIYKKEANKNINKYSGTHAFSAMLKQEVIMIITS